MYKYEQSHPIQTQRLDSDTHIDPAEFDFFSFELLQSSFSIVFEFNVFRDKSKSWLKTVNQNRLKYKSIRLKFEKKNHRL